MPSWNELLDKPEFDHHLEGFHDDRKCVLSREFEFPFHPQNLMTMFPDVNFEVKDIPDGPLSFRPELSRETVRFATALYTLNPIRYDVLTDFVEENDIKEVEALGMIKKEILLLIAAEIR